MIWFRSHRQFAIKGWLLFIVAVAISGCVAPGVLLIAAAPIGGATVALEGVDTTRKVYHQVYEGPERPGREIGEVDFCSSNGRIWPQQILSVDEKRMPFYPMSGSHGSQQLCKVYVEPGLRQFAVLYSNCCGSTNVYLGLDARKYGTRGWDLGLIRINVKPGHKYKIIVESDGYIWAIERQSDEVVAGLAKRSSPPTLSPLQKTGDRTAQEKETKDQKTREESERYWRDRIEAIKRQGPYKDCELRFDRGIDPASFSDCEERGDRIKHFEEELKRELAS